MSSRRKIYKPWVKLHIRTLYNEDIAELTDSSKWKFIECLLLAGEERNRAIESGEEQEDGFLPPLKRMAFILRTTQPVLQDDLSRLSMAGLTELRAHPDGSDRWFVSHFAKWQEPTSEAERQRFSRSTRKNKEEEKEERVRERVIVDTKMSRDSHENVTSKYTPPQPSLTTQAHPAVKAIYQVTTYWPAEVTHELLIRKLGDAPDIETLGKAYQLWRANGYSVNGFDGITDWYQELMRDPSWTPQARFKRGNGGKAQPVVKSDMKEISPGLY